MHIIKVKINLNCEIRKPPPPPPPSQKEVLAEPQPLPAFGASDPSRALSAPSPLTGTHDPLNTPPTPKAIFHVLSLSVFVPSLPYLQHSAKEPLPFTTCNERKRLWSLNLESGGDEGEEQGFESVWNASVTSTLAWISEGVEIIYTPGYGVTSTPASPLDPRQVRTIPPHVPIARACTLWRLLTPGTAGWALSLIPKGGRSVSVNLKGEWKSCINV